MSDPLEEKRRAAERSLEYVQDGMKLGLGTGSTARIAVDLLGERVRKGLRIVGVPTSERTREQAAALGIPLSTLEETPRLDLALDGADEVDPRLNLTKGGGGALLREKIVAAAARRFVVFVDSSKLVDHLGAFPTPVEVIPFACRSVALTIEEMGGKPELRKGKDGAPYRTDEGHWILDCRFGVIEDAPALAARLSVLTGVVEHGLFIAMADQVIVARPEGVEVLERK